MTTFNGFNMKEGDLIRVSEYKDAKWEDIPERIYLFTNIDGEFVCVHDGDEELYQAMSGLPRVVTWEFIIEKPEPKTDLYDQMTFPEGRSVKHRNWTNYYPVTEFIVDGLRVNGRFYSYKELAEHFTFRDGSKCRDYGGRYRTMSLSDQIFSDIPRMANKIKELEREVEELEEQNSDYDKLGLKYQALKAKALHIGQKLNVVLGLNEEEIEFMKECGGKFEEESNNL